MEKSMNPTMRIASPRMPAFVTVGSKSRRRPLETCSAGAPEACQGRREALFTGTIITSLLPRFVESASAADRPSSGKTTLGIKNLNSFQRNAERAAFLRIVEGELRTELKPEDAPRTLRLVLHDAGTYDVETESGGLNGSIFLDEELNRAENASLKPLVKRLKNVKNRIDQASAKVGYGPISRADLEVVAAKVANEKAWGAIKRARGLPSSGDIISSAFGASWPLKLGRIDTDTADPPGRIPLADANMPAVTEFFAKLNNRSYGATGFFAPKPTFDERQTFILYGSSQDDVKGAENNLAAEKSFNYKGWKSKYDQSRETVTRTDYEVDFIDFFNQLVKLGAKFDPDAYLVPIEFDTPRL